MITPISTKHEIKILASLGAKIWYEAYTPILSPGQISYMIDNFQSEEAVTKQLASGYTYYLISSEGCNVGYCGIEIQSDNRMYLSKMYLLASAHGKGLFKEMLNHLIAICREKGVRSIWLTVNKNNARAIAAYSKNGFTTIESIVTEIGNGYVMDDYVMELSL